MMQLTGPASGDSMRVAEFSPEHHSRALSEMVRRCSHETLRRRFHSSPGARRRVVDWLVGSAAAALVAVTDRDAVVGMATLHPSRIGAAELAVLVEDAWQSVGVGHLLTAEAVASARRLGYSVVLAEVMRRPAFVLDRLTHNSRGATVDFDGPVATVRIPLEAAAAGRLPGVALA